MSTWKEKLKDSQHGGENYPKLTPDYRVDVKYKDNVAIFTYYDGEKTVNFQKTIEGVLIGRTLQLTCFDNNHGTNGGSYYSTQFLNKQNKIAMFSPSGKIEILGDCDQVVAHMVQEIDKKPSMKRVLWVATKAGLMSITTILATDIDQSKRIKDEVWLDKMILINPEVYDKTDNRFSDRVHKALKIARSPLAYAYIDAGKEITDQVVEQFKVEEYIDMFLAWKNYMNNTGVTEEQIINEKQNEVDEKVKDFEKNNPLYAESLSSGEFDKKPSAEQKKERPNMPEESDDLPF